MNSQTNYSQQGYNSYPGNQITQTYYQPPSYIPTSSVVPSYPSSSYIPTQNYIPSQNYIPTQNYIPPQNYISTQNYNGHSYPSGYPPTQTYSCQPQVYSQTTSTCTTYPPSTY